MQMKELPPEKGGHEELQYVLQMLLGLSEITRNGKFTMLEYLISMAAAEASDILRGARHGTPSTNLGLD